MVRVEPVAELVGKVVGKKVEDLKAVWPAVLKAAVSVVAELYREAASARMEDRSLMAAVER